LSALDDDEAGFYFNWGDYILFRASSSLPITEQFTVSMWVQLNNLNSSMEGTLIPIF